MTAATTTSDRPTIEEEELAAQAKKFGARKTARECRQSWAEWLASPSDSILQCQLANKSIGKASSATTAQG